MSTETKTLVGVLVATVVIIVGGALLAGRNASQETSPVSQPERLVRVDDAVVGPADAKVTFVEFGDFQCPACGAVHPILKQLKEANKDKSVRFVFRHFPLEQHAHAALAAEAAAEAQRQGKFWEYHDQLFEHQNELERPALERYAEAVGLDIAAFKAALDTHAQEDAVSQDRSDGMALRVNSTPTFFINAVQYTGQYSQVRLQEAIDAALGN